MEEVIGTFFNNLKDAEANKKLKEKTHKSKFEIIKHPKGFIVVSSKQLKNT